MANEVSGDRIRDAVRERYADAAQRVRERQQEGCGSSSSCCASPQLYDPTQLRDLPVGASLASLGCGNPVLLAELKPGEVVLDLGSGGGIDVLLSARRVGPTGKVYGLDMTDEMLNLARANAREAGVENVEFLKGHIESIPLPDASVDVVISNCVINLSADKDCVLAEAFRVLKPGGRFAVADVVVQGECLPEALRESLSLWADCVSGALTEDEYRGKLADAGFIDVGVQVLTARRLADVSEDTLCCLPADAGPGAGAVVASAFVRATKPTLRGHSAR